MKTSRWSIKSILSLAILLLISSAGSVCAADFFPLDIWEEMINWQSKTSVPDTSDPKTYHASMASPAETVEKARTSFPLDVWEELNMLGRDTGNSVFLFSVKTDASNKSQANPYWLPKELQTDPSPGIAKAYYGNYLTDSR